MSGKSFAQGILLLCLAIYCHVSAAENSKGTIIMGTSHGPPYMDRATNSGLDIDIPRAVLERLGYTVEIRYMSLARAQAQLRAKRIDFTAPLFLGDKLGIYSSEPHIYYRPTVFSLKQRQLKINNIEDISNYSITTFQGAGGYFGNTFIKASQKSPRYSELHDMTVLPKILYATRTDLVVLDYYIFHHQLRHMGKVDWKSTLATHDIFPRVPAVVGFHNPRLRDIFNTELASFKTAGGYAKILERYTPD